MRTKTRTLTLKLYEKQEQFRASQTPSVTFQGGAGSGKTRAGCAKALVRALESPGCRGMIVGASFPSLEQSILPHLRAVGEELGLAETWQHDKAKGCVTLPNGSLFWLRSADKPESLLGADLAWVWGDEVGLWKRDAYRYLVGRLRQPGFPHQFFATFTPKGRNWAWDELGTAREGLEVIQASSLDNPFVDEDFRQRLRREYGEGSQFWRQEVLGEFVAWEGLIYPDFGEAQVGDPPEGLPMVAWGAGVDWGWTNPGVMLLGSLDAAGHLWITAELYEEQRALEWWQQRGIAWHQAHRLRALWCDPSEPGNIDHLHRAGLPAEKANNEVIPGITAVASRITEGRLHVSPACEHLLAELGMYTWKQSRDGTLKRDEPEKVHDHACDALRYLVMGLSYSVRKMPQWMLDGVK